MADDMKKNTEKVAPDDDPVGEEIPLTAQPTKNEIPSKKVALAPTLGHKPVEIICPQCNARTKTNLAYHITYKSHLTVLICSLLTWPCCLCFLAGIPYCATYLHKVDHHCSACNALVGNHSNW